MKLFPFLSAILLSISVSAAENGGTGSPPPRIPIKDFFDNPKISSADISPDAKSYAYLAPDNNRMNIWVCGTDEDFDKARLITHDKQRGIRNFSWSRDSKYVLYMQDEGGNENFHIYRADPSKPDAAALDLTPERGRVRTSSICRAKDRTRRSLQ